MQSGALLRCSKRHQPQGTQSPNSRGWGAQHHARPSATSMALRLQDLPDQTPCIERHLSRIDVDIPHPPTWAPYPSHPPLAMKPIEPYQLRAIRRDLLEYDLNGETVQSTLTLPSWTRCGSDLGTSFEKYREYASSSEFLGRPMQKGRIGCVPRFCSTQAQPPRPS